MLSFRTLWIALALTACSAAHPPVATPWQIEIGTSGGITGRGVGDTSIASDGTVHVRLLDGKECTAHASRAEVERIEAILSGASPQQWARSYQPADICCDRVEYSLTLTEGEQKWSTRWIDSPPPMPADLTAVIDAIFSHDDPQSVRSLHQEECVKAK